MTSDSYFPLLRRVFVLSMVTFYCHENPSVGLKHFDDLNHFIRFHTFDVAKVIKRILFCKIKLQKSILFNTIYDINELTRPNNDGLIVLDLSHNFAFLCSISILFKVNNLGLSLLNLHFVTF